MKKIFALMLALAGLMSLSTACLKEEVSDVLITLEVDNDINAYMHLTDADRATVREQGTDIEQAFAAQISATKIEKAGDRYWIARNQRSNKTVSEMMLEAGDKAYASVQDIKPIIPITVSIHLDSTFGVETVADYSF